MNYAKWRNSLGQKQRGVIVYATNWTHMHIHCALVDAKDAGYRILRCDGYAELY